MNRIIELFINNTNKMNLILEALKMLYAEKKLNKRRISQRMNLGKDVAGLVLKDIIGMTGVPGLVIKVCKKVGSGMDSNLDQVEVWSTIKEMDVEGKFFVGSLKNLSRQFTPVKKGGSRHAVIKEYSTRKKDGPKPSLSEYPKTEVERILRSSTYTVNEENQQSRLELLLKRKSVYTGSATKNVKKKTVQGSILGFFKR